MVCERLACNGPSGLGAACQFAAGATNGRGPGGEGALRWDLMSRPFDSIGGIVSGSGPPHSSFHRDMPSGGSGVGVGESGVNGVPLFPNLPRFIACGLVDRFAASFFVAVVVGGGLGW